MLRNATVLLLGLATLTAQESLTARHFLPQGYKTVMFADLAAMRDRDIWDDIEVSVLKLAFGQMEKELGFALDDLDRLTMVMDLGESEPGAMQAERREVRVLEGNKPLPLHASMLNGRWQQERIGKYDAYRRNTYQDEVFFQPTPEMQVGGTMSLLQPVMDGTRGACDPAADVMSLLSGRDKRLAYFVLDVANPVMKKRFFRDTMPGVEWPGDDMPTFLCVRLLATGDEDDLHLTIDAVMRHQQAGKGIEITEAAVDSMLLSLKKNPQMLLINSVLKNLEKRRDGTDLNLRLDLGRTRHAVGQLAMLLVPWFVMGGEAQPAQAVELEVVEPPPPPPPEKPKGKGKPKGNGGR